MLRALYSGASGMKTLSQGMQAVSNNLANVNTVGFKQQQALFEDLMSQYAGTGNSASTSISQVGLGSRLTDIRTMYGQGPYESGTDITDLSINGKGFFQVTSGDKIHYTRAGNFRFDKDGNLVDPNGFVLNGRPILDGVEGATTGISLPPGENGRNIMPAKATTSITAINNLGSGDKSSDAANPFFSLLSKWNGAADSPLGDSAYSYKQSIKVYDASGNAHDVTIYFDGAGESGGNKYFEFVVGMDPAHDGSALAGTSGAGLLMAGTLTFNSSGQLVNMSAYTPTGADATNLGNWAPASFGADGLPQFAATFAGGGGTQRVGLDLGLSSSSGAWTAGAGSPAAVGSNASSLAGMAGVTLAATSTTAYGGSSSELRSSQNGYAQGFLAGIDINSEGIITGRYSNGQKEDLYRITLYRFTSEDGLRREGMNHFSATRESGAAEEGLPDTENYGTVAAKTLEQSNVSMEREFVNMIIYQRGFQTNSKSIMTADTMIQKALELKRS
ncbi:flagellar hook protein FlgE [Nitratidesulfovibrio sp. 1201_IL3209]|uniref:flagellar hook protein FlgE n=1 Tax=Nitratidesulfovibrio sp. 1201_IL3209 TaxID=3084053 RepID=UPI002FDB930B